MAELEFTDKENKKLISVIFKTVLKNMEKGGGRSLVGFWDTIGRLSPGNTKRYNLQYKKVYTVILRDSDGNPLVEEGRWTVWAYEYDWTKEPPFATIENTKTLIVKDLMVDPDDEYHFLGDVE
jgi:hypothetical protein